METPPNTPAPSCEVCGQTFTQRKNLLRHERNGKCHPEIPIQEDNFVYLIKGDVVLCSTASKIVGKIGSKLDKFRACQLMGVAVANLYPLCFDVDKRRSRISYELDDFLPKSSEEVLRELLDLSKNSPIFIKKNQKFSCKGKVYDLKEYAVPKSSAFEVNEFSEFFEIKLAKNPTPEVRRSKRALFGEGGATPVRQNSLGMSCLTLESQGTSSGPLPSSNCCESPGATFGPSMDTPFGAEAITTRTDSRFAKSLRLSDSSERNLDRNLPGLGDRSVESGSGGSGGAQRGVFGGGPEGDPGDDSDNDPDGDDPDDDPNGHHGNDTDNSDDEGPGDHHDDPDPDHNDPDPDHNDPDPDEPEADDGEPEPEQDDYLAKLWDIRFWRTERLQYEGYGALAGPPSSLYQARVDLSLANSSIHSFISLHLCPEITTPREMKYMTGCGIDVFDELCELLGIRNQRNRFFSPSAKLFCYLEKMRRGRTFEDMCFDFHCTEPVVHGYFWECCMKQYLGDTSILHRNYPVIGFPPPGEILEEGFVDDEYTLALFAPLIPRGYRLVLWAYDHTYLYNPKFAFAELQRREFFSKKNAHCAKFGLLCNSKGKVVYYSPLSGSCNPDNGDGHMTICQLHCELHGEVTPRLDPLLRPQRENVVTVTCLDRGYTKETRINMRRDLFGSMHQYFTDEQLVNHNPHAHYFSICSTGDRILDENLNWVDNPVSNILPPNPNRRNQAGQANANEPNLRTKKTCREANTDSFTCKQRWKIEAANAGTKQYRILDARVIDQHFSERIGAKLCPDHPNIPRLELILNNALALYNRNHAGFVRTWEMPEAYTEAQMGENFRQRLAMHNPLDHFENLGYRKNIFKDFPAGNVLRGWTKVSYGDDELLAITGFPRLPLRNFTLVTHGSYQIRNGRKYITDIRQKEVIDLINQLQDNEVDWDEYTLMISTLPVDKDVYFFDQHTEPVRWDVERFGPWCPRRLIHVKIPSLHSKAKSYPVIIAYVPQSMVLEENENQIHNPLGFTPTGYRRILGWSCQSHKCIPGYRLAGCCSHVAAALLFLGVYAYDEASFETFARPAPFFDIRHPKSLNKELLGGAP